MTQITATLLLRPVAKAFGMFAGEMATRGLGMSASAQSRSTIAVQLAAPGSSG